MSKNKKLEVSEINVIIQAVADSKEEIKDIARDLVEKYEGNMSTPVALETAKEYYLLGVLAMRLDPEKRKIATKKVEEYYKEEKKRRAEKEKKQAALKKDLEANKK